MKPDPYLAPYTKMNSQEIKDINVRVETIKFLTGSTDVNFCDFELIKGFLDTTPTVQATKGK